MAYHYFKNQNLFNLMKNDKQFIWGIIVLLIVLPYTLLLFYFIQSTITSGFSETIEMYKRSFIPDFDSFNAPSIFYSLKNSIYYFATYIVFPILTIIGLTTFKEKGTSKLLFVLSVYSFIESILGYIPNKIWLFKAPTALPIATSFFFSTVYLVLGFFTSKYLSNRVKLKTIDFEDISETTLQERAERFGNLLIDRFISAYISISMAFYVYSALQYAYEYSDLSSYYYSVFTYLICIILYYALSEGLFQATLGKIITKSTIINTDGEKIGFGRALGRTLCRFIPFEPFSFLFSERGWHDSITDTYVVKAE